MGEKMKTNIILQGDCISEMKKLEENSVDAIITDPPYGLEFMGKDWDKFKDKNQRFGGGGGAIHDGGKTLFGRLTNKANSVYQYTNEQKLTMQNFFYKFGIESIRVLKPGGFALIMGGTRTYHRLVCGIEDAGFEIRDTIMWLYGSGFPKSLNIGKQIDKIQGNEREVVGENKNARTNLPEKDIYEAGIRGKGCDITKGNSEWEGWGTALKPACEPIVVARKPLSEKNVALNVLKHGTGGLNIDACRIEGSQKKQDKPKGGIWNPSVDNDSKLIDNTQGRFPANIILDEESAKLFPDDENEYDESSQQQTLLGNTINLFQDKSASRFFYCAKASKSERNLGCEEMEQRDSRKEDGSAKSLEIFSNQYTESSGNPTKRGITSKRANNHPTVKPIKLMEYLIKLVSREGATILDPFLGSGTTLIACQKLNRKGIGIEKEIEYIKIAKARLKPFLEQTSLQE